jgi:glycosyltransferase involved in cell wall biosynthesis
MRIALINTIKPAEGTGDGMTEYTYQLYTRLSKSNKVDLIYSVDKLVRNNVKGLLYTNTLFKNKLAKIDWQRYDIVHITNQEMGFVAKLVKKSNSRTKVITTIQDFARVDRGVQKGILQHTYNRIVRRSIADAFSYSDLILFTSSQTEKDAKKHFKSVYKKETINLAVREGILKAPSRKKKNPIFTVGYVGSLASHKNVIMVLKAAKILKSNECNFIIYGKGVEYEDLIRFKEKNGLDRVRFMGFAPEDKIAQIYDSFDVFMFPSKYEGFGLPILEAQSRGIPIIVYKKGKVPKEVTKYCFKAGSSNEAARIITELQKKGYPKEKRNQATRYARSFSWDACAKNTLNLYVYITLNEVN